MNYLWVKNYPRCRVVRKLGFTLLALIFIIGCGSAPKTSQKYPKKKNAKAKNYSYYDSGSADPANQDSIEDVIYSELAKRQQALLRKYSVPNTSHSLSGVKFDIPIVVNDRVSTWIDYFANGSGRKHYSRYLSRSTRFVPTQLRILKEVGVPRDLIFLSMIESGFNTHAYSSAAASGLWQFIRSTGRLYGLESDYWVDERRDPEKATLAAAQHLKDLYGEFGDWYLAFAAYNAGSGKVRRAIAGTGSNNFWTLASSSYLRQETKDYVPKLLAAAIIAKSPEKYGFEDVIFQDAIATEKVTISTPTDVEVIAECAGVDTDLIRLVNPELIRNMTPPDRPNYQVNVPRGTKGTFEKKYARLSPSERLKNVQYVARNGDTLREVAAENGTSVSALMTANPDLTNRLRSGQTVLIARAYDSPPSLPFSSSAYPTATKGSRLLDLIAENTDVKPEKSNKKKKDKEKQEKLQKEQSLPQEEMKVAWKEQMNSTATPSTEKTGVGFISSAHAEDKPAAATANNDVAMNNPNPSAENAVNPAATPSLDVPVSPSPTAATEGDKSETPPANQDAQITEALNKVDASPTPEDAKGAVRVKSSGQVTPANSKKVVAIKVKKGETLSQIASRYNVSMAELKEWNKIKGKGNVLVGQKLIIKGGSAEEAAVKTTKEDSRVVASSEKKSVKSAKKENVSKTIAYKVRKGDTINKIAKKYDVAPADIVGMNGLSKKAALKPGVVLKIKTKTGLDEG